MAEPNIKYLAVGYGSQKIRALICSKETSKFAWLEDFYVGGGARKLLKESQVFNTWAEAHAELTRRAEERLNLARLQLQQAQGFAGNVRGMKEPTNG